MVEQVQKSTQGTVPQAEEVVVVTGQSEKDSNVNNVEKEAAAVAETAKEEEAMEVKPVEEEASAESDEIPKPSETHEAEEEKIPESSSFEEESNRVADLPPLQKKALEKLKLLVQEALINHEFTEPPSSSSSSSPPKVETKPVPVEEEVQPEKPAAAEPVETEKTEEEKTEEVKDVAADNSADDDGAKTVEAIEETIVAVSSASSVPPQQSSTLAKELAEESKASPETESKEDKDQTLLAKQSPEEVSIWGIPLLADERSDVVLLKFLRARDFKVKDAFTMIKNTVRWRKQFGIDELVEEDSESDGLEKVVFMHGVDKEGHPVCYNVYGEFRSKELYQKTFSDEEKRQRFLRWRIRFLEKSIRKLDFTPGGVCTIVQVNDLKNSPGPGKWELRHATKQALQLLQDNYPEFVAKQV